MTHTEHYYSAKNTKDRLARDASPEVRVRVARHPNTSKEAILLLIQDEHEEVWKMALRRI